MFPLEVEAGSPPVRVRVEVRRKGYDWGMRRTGSPRGPSSYKAFAWKRLGGGDDSVKRRNIWWRPLHLGGSLIGP